jgi:hypothetical protein
LLWLAKSDQVNTGIEEVDQVHGDFATSLQIFTCPMLVQRAEKMSFGIASGLRIEDQIDRERN